MFLDATDSCPEHVFGRPAVSPTSDQALLHCLLEQIACVSSDKGTDIYKCSVIENTSPRFVSNVQQEYPQAGGGDDLSLQQAPVSIIVFTFVQRFQTVKAQVGPSLQLTIKFRFT